MTMKVVDHFTWKANSLHQLPGIETVTLVRPQIDYAGCRSCDTLKGRYTLSVDKGWLKNG